MDERLRRQEREAAYGGWEDRLTWRNALRRAGQGSSRLRPDLDLGIPHVWEVVGEGKNVSLTYGEGRDLLASLCSKDDAIHPFIGSTARPLTFKETILARIDQFEAFQKGKKSVKVDGTLWTSWLDTSTAIVYRRNSTRFKIVPFYPGFLSHPASSRAEFITISDSEYEAIEGDELDVSNPAHGVYNQQLTQEQVAGDEERGLEPHQGWLLALGGDTKENRVLLKRYAAIVFGLLNRNTAMRFWTVPHQQNQARPYQEIEAVWVLPQANQLLALCSSDLANYCNCNGYRNLYYNARFVRVRSLL